MGGYEEGDGGKWGEMGGKGMDAKTSRVGVWWVARNNLENGKDWVLGRGRGKGWVWGRLRGGRVVG